MAGEEPEAAQQPARALERNRAHFYLLATDMERFLNHRSEPARAREPLPAPPGSPMGEGNRHGRTGAARLAGLQAERVGALATAAQAPRLRRPMVSTRTLRFPPAFLAIAPISSSCAGEPEPASPELGNLFFDQHYTYAGCHIEPAGCSEAMGDTLTAIGQSISDINWVIGEVCGKIKRRLENYVAKFYLYGDDRSIAAGWYYRTGGRDYIDLNRLNFMQVYRDERRRTLIHEGHHGWHYLTCGWPEPDLVTTAADYIVDGTT